MRHTLGNNRNILQLKAWNTGTGRIGGWGFTWITWIYMEFLWWRYDQNWSQPSQAARQCQDVKQPWPQGQRPKDLQFLAFGGAAQTHATLTATGGCGNRFCLQLNGSFPCGKAIGVSRYHFSQKNLVYTLHLHIRFSLSLDLSRSDQIQSDSIRFDW